MPAAPDVTQHVPYLRYWGILGLVMMLLMVLITPPFQVPDEAQHFFRAYQISEGQLIAEVRGETAGGDLPSSLQDLSRHFLGTTAMHAPRPVLPTPLDETLAQLGRPLNEDNRSYLIFTGAAAYGPLAYVPQVLGIKIGAVSGASVLTTLYLSRIVNGICALALLMWALRLLPWGRELVSFAALLPMAVYLYASVSPDAMILSAAFLYSALILNRMVSDTWSHRDTALAIVSATTFCMIKPVYAPLLLLGFVQLLYTRRRWFTFITQSAILLATCTITFLWGLAAAKAILPVPEGISIPGQIDHVLGNPIQYLLTLARSLLWNDFYYQQLVGKLGWLAFGMPAVAYWIPVAAAVLAVGGEQPALSRRAVLFVVASLSIVGICVVLVLTALYVSWTPVGNIVVKGIQGRYFLPLLPLILLPMLLLCGRRAWWSRPVVQAGILCLIAVEGGIALYTVSTKYAVMGG